MPTDLATVEEILHLLSANNYGSSCLDSLDAVSAELACDIHYREHLGQSSTQIWLQLSQLWSNIGKAEQNVFENKAQTQKALSLARFTRNLVAGSPSNQTAAFQCEPFIRKLVFDLTSFAIAEDESTHKLTQVLAQTLSNMVTANDSLLSQLWRVYMFIPEEKSILLRLVSHPNDGVAVASLVLALNCMAGNKERTAMVTETYVGKRFCVLLLDKMAFEVEVEDETRNSSVFEMGWRIFEAIVNFDLVHPLMTLTHIDGEPTSPHRTTLLKILDSYLLKTLATKSPVRRDNPQSDLNQTFLNISKELLSFSIELITYANASLKRSLDSSDGPAELPTAGEVSEEKTASMKPPRYYDTILPKVSESIILVVQSFCTLSLVKDTSGQISAFSQRMVSLLTEASLQQGQGLVEAFIEFLRLLDDFVPRIMFGKASWSTPRPGVLPSIDPEDTAFSYVKRDVVRLIGILCYENRAVQDRVRLCGGITAVMNLCVTDERNPYLREHALFALHNLLEGNSENQAIVDAIKPMGIWDENGILRDQPGVRK